MTRTSLNTSQTNQRHPPTIHPAWLILASALLLTLAAAPFGQWYLAWFALAPWLVAIGRASTLRAALLQGWLAGILYFAANLWWLWTASIPGTIVLVLYFALFWAFAAGVIRSLRLLSSAEYNVAQPVYCIFAIAAVWVAAEWLRCNVASGFPWLPLGSTQSPIPLLCQTADIGGPWIVSFWVTLPNTLAATVLLSKAPLSACRAPAIVVALTLAAVVGYGAWRLQSTATTPGPQVMLIQSSFRHLPGGAPTVDRQQAADYFIAELEKRLAVQPADLVVLPEAAFPPINDEARRELARSQIGPSLEATYQRLMKIAADHHTALLLGGNAVTGWTTHGSEHIGSEIRNCAYYFDPQAQQPLSRYDKIYLARFSERAPLTIGPEWLRRVATFISAARAIQPMVAGSLEDLRPFHLKWSLPQSDTVRSMPAQANTSFIAPICLENIDPAVMAQMVRGSSPNGKQADFVANISNDGWFATQEKYQHLQTTVFRCIENRLPMVRCSNTGISALIDSTGHVRKTIGPNSAGIAVGRIELDARHTFFTRYGDVFPIVCVLLTAGILLLRTLRGFGAQMRAKSANNN